MSPQQIIIILFFKNKIKFVVASTYLSRPFPHHHPFSVHPFIQSSFQFSLENPSIIIKCFFFVEHSTITQKKKLGWMDDDDTRTTWIDQTQEKTHTQFYNVYQKLSLYCSIVHFCLLCLKFVFATQLIIEEFHRYCFVSLYMCGFNDDNNNQCVQSFFSFCFVNE